MPIRVDKSGFYPAATSTPVLKEGSSGPAVVALQKKLAAIGFDPGMADGVFGAKTLAAVLSFQKANALTADGAIGPNSWGRLNASQAAPPPPSATPTIQRGSAGAAVGQLQRNLARAGFDPGKTDGDFGSQTHGALKAFQKSAGLPATGVADARTWQALSGSSFEVARTTSPISTGPRLLRVGDSGSDVSQLQVLLAKAGFDPGSTDGVFGTETQKQLLAFQRARGLGVDGVCGPESWSELKGNSVATVTTPLSADLRQRILAIAQGEIGHVEATNRNDGEILKYPHYFNRASEAWCADFASWVCTHAGKPLNFASVAALKDHLAATGAWKGRSNPQPGDLVIFDFGHNGWPDHVGIVKAVNPDGSIETIEGNAGNAAGRQGVWEHTRPMRDILGFGNV